MNEKVLIRDKEYTFVKDYRDNESLREELNSLTDKTYGFNFKEWYESGYWGDGYIPYSLLDGEKLVANASVSIMKMNVLGKKKNYIQIGTVMTADKYRNKGLSRYLIEKIICEYKEKCDYIYLFANDTVLDFYPKFGFEKVNEYRYSISRVKKDTNIIANKLNIHNYEDKQLLESIIENSIVNSKLYVEENKNLIMFYCLGFLKECIYYIKEYNVIAICEYEDDTLNINDIFCNRKFDLEKVINVLIDDKTKRVNLGFTPIDIDGYRKNMLDDKNDTLFVLKDKENIFKNNYLMFPILSHA
ncbi:GNAT family N-acetyltransferase [Clostridioides difficile]